MTLGGSDKHFPVSYQIANRRQDVRMLTLGFRKGDSLSLCYTELESIYYSEGLITLKYQRLTINVFGRNLERIHRSLTSHSLLAIHESDDDQSDEAYIEEIKLVESNDHQYQG